ncbi:hypothetical protein AB0J52_25355 [Spirillospora sp. NPDC049652]
MNEGTGGGPEGFLTTPKVMADVVMRSYRTHLSAQSETPHATGPVNALAAERAAPALVGLPERPPDEALRVARAVVADAYAEAMRTFGVPSSAIDAIERRVYAEIQETVEEHARLHAERIDDQISRLRKLLRPGHPTAAKNMPGSGPRAPRIRG